MSEALAGLGRKGFEMLGFFRISGQILAGFFYWLLIAPWRGFPIRGPTTPARWRTSPSTCSTAWT